MRCFIIIIVSDLQQTSLDMDLLLLWGIRTGDLRHVKTGNSALEQAFLISQHFFFGCATRPDNNKEGKHNHDGPIYSLRSQQGVANYEDRKSYGETGVYLVSSLTSREY
jgi:hypothetical protein